MQEYIVSARKYRPMTFSTVVGQQALTTTLKNAIHSGKLAHAYLFCGPRGVGKTTCARIFAKTINCLSPQADGESCGQCESCKSFDEGRSLNIHELDAASNNSVEDIRELIKQVQIPPQTGKYKVFIIDEVHMLSTSAFNAFLKTLEEPPHYVIFILATTEKHKILPTILSRCQVYDFNRITLADTLNHLREVSQKEGYTADDAALQLIAEKADGGMRDALSILDQMIAFTNGNLSYETVCQNLNVLSAEYYFRIVDLFLENNTEACMLLLNEIINKGFDPGHFVSGLASHMRQLLVARDESTLPLLECNQQMQERFRTQAKKCSFQFIYRAIKLANDCDQAYRQSHNKRLQVEICLIQCAQLTQGEDEPGSGPGPKHILKPIFNTQVQAQPAPRANVPTSQANEPTSQAKEPSPQAQSKSKLATLKLANLGPSIHIKEDTITDKVQEEKCDTQELEAPYTESDVILQWNKMINTMPHEQKAMQIRMRDMTPIRIGENTYQVTANNRQIAQELNKMMPDILANIRQGLKNCKFQLTVHVAEVREIKRIISKREMFKELIEQNSGIETMNKMLNLELI